MDRKWVVGGCILALVAAPKFMKTVALILLFTLTIGNNGCLGFLAAILGAIIKVVVGIVQVLGPVLMGGMRLATGIMGAVGGAQQKQTTVAPGSSVMQNSTQAQDVQSGNNQVQTGTSTLEETDTGRADEPDGATQEKRIPDLAPVPAQ